MKKLLLASAAIVATAGVAAAQNVNVTGDARFGLTYVAGEPVAGVPAVLDGDVVIIPAVPSTTTPSTTTMTHRVRLAFTAERETNAGVKVGVWTRFNVQHSNQSSGHAAGDAGANGNNFDGSRIYVSANGITLTAGTADGAVASRVALYGGSLGFTGGVGRAATHTLYAEEGQGANVVRADYTNSGFTVSASYGYGVAGAFNNGSGELGVSYSMSGITVGAGIREGGNWSVSAGYTQGAFAVGALVSNVAFIPADHPDDEVPGSTNYRLHGTYTMGDIVLGATYTRVGATDNYGLGVNYNLGGGASIRGAVGSHGGRTRAELGMNFSF